MRRRQLVIPLLLVSSLAGGAPAQAAPPPVEKVVKGMQAFYVKTKDLKGKFKQVYTDTLYNRTRTSYGYLYVRKPGMMRWNYVTPERKSFIADGKELWVFEPEDNQAFRNPLDTSTLSTGLTFLLGSGDLTKEFRLAYAPKDERIGGVDHLVLKLLPIEPTAQYEYMLLAVRRADFVVTESVVVGRHSRNHFFFSKLLFNTGMSRKRFRFRPPPGTRVVDGAKAK